MTPLAWIIAGALAILVHEGWERRRAFAMNLLSASTFLVGGLLAWGAARAVDLSFLLPLTAGNFLYIAASDLVPEVREDRSLRTNLVHLLSLLAGLLLLYVLRVALES
jgi:zinc and cadmium transporter